MPGGDVRRGRAGEELGALNTLEDGFPMQLGQDAGNRLVKTDEPPFDALQQRNAGEQLRGAAQLEYGVVAKRCGVGGDGDVACDFAVYLVALMSRSVLILGCTPRVQTDHFCLCISS